MKITEEMEARADLLKGEVKVSEEMDAKANILRKEVEL